MTPHNPVFLKKTPPHQKKLCNDLGLCGVKGNTLSKTSPTTKRNRQSRRVTRHFLPNWHCTDCDEGTSDMVRRHFSFGNKRFFCFFFPYFKPVCSISGPTVCCCSPAAGSRVDSSPLTMNRGKEDASALSKLVFVLFAEAISSGEEIPAALLVHLPHV